MSCVPTTNVLIYRIDDIQVDTARGCIVRAGYEVAIKPKAFRVLVHLLKERDRLVTKEELLDLFWSGTAVTDDALTQCIARLRRALSDDPRNPTYLKTVPRMGYRFVGPVEEIFPETVASLEPVPDPVSRQPPPPALRVRRIGWVLVGVLAAGSLGAGAFWTTASLYRPPPGVHDKRVIAILPFENRSGQNDLDWLREGLPDMLATTFSRSKSLDVLSRGQVYAHGQQGAHATVSGSFSKLGSSMRVDVRIYDTHTGAVLGTDDITVDQQDRILTQVDFLAARLAARLGPQTPNQDRRGLASLMTSNLEAYRYYSLGLEKAEAAQTAEAIELFERALALDPGFVMARARIGYAYAVTAAELERGRPYLEDAFRMSGKLTGRDRRHIMAWYSIANRDYQNAIRGYRELLNEYPNEPEAYFRLAGLLRGEGRHEEALEFLHRANAIDSEDPKIYNSLSAVYSEMGKHDDAISMADHYRALAPGDPNAYDSLGLSYYMAGQYERALEAYRKALELSPGFGIVSLHRALVYAATGRVRDAVRESLSEAEDGAGHVACARAWGQAMFILWRSGKTVEAKKLTEKAPPECDPRLVQMVLGRSAMPNANTFLNWTTGRGGQFGQRTSFFYLAQYAKMQGRTEEMLTNLRQLLNMKPAWAEPEIFENVLGDAYLALGRVDDAISEYERALRLFPGIARARYHLAQAYQRKGEDQLARDQFRQFLELWKQADPDLPEVAEARRWAQ